MSRTATAKKDELVIEFRSKYATFDQTQKKAKKEKKKPMKAKDNVHY